MHARDLRVRVGRFDVGDRGDRQDPVRVLAEAQGRELAARAERSRQNVDERVFVDILDHRQAVKPAVEKRWADHAQHRARVGKRRIACVDRLAHDGAVDAQRIGEQVRRSVAVVGHRTALVHRGVPHEGC